MDANIIIAQLKEELISQKGFLWNKKNKDSIAKCLNMLDELKNNLPASIQEASFIISQKQKILNSAQETANKIIRDAESKASELVNEQAILKETEAKANEAIESANKRCNQIYSSTRDNIDKMLKAIEDYLIDNLNVVRNNREELAGGIILNNKNNQNKKQ
ncbi:MAG: hypothetical protein K6F08_02465 [bacterium]|nr:hypothetical protein [bacterium]